MPMGPALKREYPEIQHTVRFWSQTDVVRYKGQSFTERLTFTDATVFEAFSFPLQQGDPDFTLLEQRKLCTTPVANNPPCATRPHHFRHTTPPKLNSSPHHIEDS